MGNGYTAHAQRHSTNNFLTLLPSLPTNITIIFSRTLSVDLIILRLGNKIFVESAVYNIHNHLRHNGNNRDLNKQLYMSLSAVAVPKLLRTAWEELFKHPHQLDL